MSGAAVHLDTGPIAIVGLGLIGGSIARGLRAAGYTGRLIGCVATPADATRACELELVDAASTELAEAVTGAAMVVVAVPVGAMTDVFVRLAPLLEVESVVTDVGSTKSSVVVDARAALGERVGRFVPGHPIAGTERSGIEAGFATLYQDRRVILTPVPETDRDALQQVATLWQMLGARVSEMDPAHHDDVLAATSHLPHVLAFALVDTLARLAERTEIFDYAAGGFADFTRIASSDPALWTDIVVANRDAVLPVLDRYIGDLEKMRRYIDECERSELLRVFSSAKRARDRFVHSRNGKS